MEIRTIFILLSEGQDFIQKDVESLLEKKIFSIEEITSGNSLLVCISRDYLDLPNNTPAVMIRDQISNVFCPKWRICSTYYKELLGIMGLKKESIPNINVITDNKDIFDNLDYYLHLTRFEKRNKMYLPDYKNGFVPIVSEIRREEIKQLGEVTVAVLEMAGYEEDINNQVPGWIFQCANPWMTRVLDLYDISPAISLLPDPITNLKMTRDELKKGIENPIILGGPKVGEDIRVCIVESFEVRKDLYNFSKDILERLRQI